MVRFDNLSVYHIILNPLLYVTYFIIRKKTANELLPSKVKLTDGTQYRYQWVKVHAYYLNPMRKALLFCFDR